MMGMRLSSTSARAGRCALLEKGSHSFAQCAQTFWKTLIKVKEQAKFVDAGCIGINGSALPLMRVVNSHLIGALWC